MLVPSAKAKLFFLTLCYGQDKCGGFGPAKETPTCTELKKKRKKKKNKEKKANRKGLSEEPPWSMLLLLNEVSLCSSAFSVNLQRDENQVGQLHFPQHPLGDVALLLTPGTGQDVCHATCCPAFAPGAPLPCTEAQAPPPGKQPRSCAAAGQQLALLHQQTMSNRHDKCVGK